MARPTGDDLQILLVEYQKAQDSAEHHDDLVSTLSGLWLGSAVLIGFVLSGLGSSRIAHHKPVLYLVILVGVLVSVLALYWATRSRQIKDKKYERCREIENELGGLMHQHTARAGSGRRWRWWLYCSPITALIAVWVALLVDVIHA
jgi:uncharacterized membrane protein YfcA